MISHYPCSSKSELLRTLVLALVATHPPEQLNLVLVDFKGGATFLGLDGLAHVAAIITNLAEEAVLVERMADALSGEITRRQELLRRAGGLADVNAYERIRRERPELPPLPALVIVVDEFTELLTRFPGFAELFVMIGRLGRSLHIHLLLASQRLEEGRLRGLDSHLSYRIGLKTFSAAESRAAIGIPDAFGLPAAPGHGFLATAAGEPLRFRAAYVSGPEPEVGGGAPGARGPGSVVRYTADNHVGDVGDRRAPAAIGDTPGVSVLERVVGVLRGHGTPAHRVWTPPLPASVGLAALPTPVGAGPEGEGPQDTDARRAASAVAIGLVDVPFAQRTDALVVDLAGAGGHVAIVGGPRSGTSTAARTLVTALAASHGADEFRVHALDLTGGGLEALADLPHVGTVAPRSDPARVRRVVAETVETLDERQASGADAGGRRVLVVDGWQTLRTDFEDLVPVLARIAADGLAVGVHLVLTAKRWSELRLDIRDLLGTRLELRLGDPAESVVDRRAAASVPVDRPGRGIGADGLHTLVALPELVPSGGWSGTVAAIRGRVAERERAAGLPPGSTHAAPVRMLPEYVAASGLPPVGPGLRLRIGDGESASAPPVLDLDADPLALVLGDESGKSCLLRMLAGRLTEAVPPGRLKVLVVDPRRSLLGAVPEAHLAGYAATEEALEPMIGHLVRILRDRLPGPGITQERLRARNWWEGPEILVLVDDHDLAATQSGNPLAPLAEMLPHARDVGLRLVVARRCAGAGRAMYDPLLSRMRDLGASALVMNGRPEEGPVYADVRPEPRIPGRGVLVTRSGKTLVQVAHTGDGDA